MVEIFDPFKTPGIVDPFKAPDTSLAQNVGVVSRAAAPPAVASAAGALLGSRFGTAGSRLGGALGPLVLAGGDIATTGYNIAAPYVGLPTASLPTETIQNVMERVGFGRQPQTYPQQLLSDVTAGGTSGGIQAAAFNVLARRLGPQMAQNLMPQAAVRSQRPDSLLTTLSAQPAAQVGAGAGGAVGGFQ